MKTFLITFCLLLSVSLFAANPTFQSFDTNAFTVNQSGNSIGANSSAGNPNALVIQSQITAGGISLGQATNVVNGVSTNNYVHIRNGGATNLVVTNILQNASTVGSNGISSYTSNYFGGSPLFGSIDWWIWDGNIPAYSKIMHLDNDSLQLSFDLTVGGQAQVSGSLQYRIFGDQNNDGGWLTPYGAATNTFTVGGGNTAIDPTNAFQVNTLKSQKSLQVGTNGVLYANGGGVSNIPGTSIQTATLPATAADATWPKGSNYLHTIGPLSGAMVPIFNGTFDAFGSPQYTNASTSIFGSTVPNGLVTNNSPVNIIATGASLIATNGSIISTNTTTKTTFIADSVTGIVSSGTNGAQQIVANPTTGFVVNTGGNSNYLGGFTVFGDAIWLTKTNAAPSDAVNPKTWFVVTNNAGGKFLIPGYQ